MRLRIDKGCESSANHTGTLEGQLQRNRFIVKQYRNKPEYGHEDRDIACLAIVMYLPVLVLFFDGIRRMIERGWKESYAPWPHRRICHPPPSDRGVLPHLSLCLAGRRLPIRADGKGGGGLILLLTTAALSVELTKHDPCWSDCPISVNILDYNSGPSCAKGTAVLGLLLMDFREN
jgi:hypothetical protein